MSGVGMTSLAEFCALVALCVACAALWSLLREAASLIGQVTLYVRDKRVSMAQKPVAPPVPPHMKPAYYNGSATVYLCHCGDPVPAGEYHQTSARCRP
jgi:hypothetical protein